MRFYKVCSALLAFPLLSVLLAPTIGSAEIVKMPIGSGPMFQVNCSADGGNNTRIIQLTQSEYYPNFFYTAGTEETGGDELPVTELANGTRLFAGADVLRDEDGTLRLNSVSMEGIAADGRVAAALSHFEPSMAPALKVGGLVTVNLAAYAMTGVDNAGCTFRVVSLGRSRIVEQ